MTAITRLTLTDFRSHAHATITAGPGLVVITGDNGAGKTNILDAISLLAPGRGLRGAPLSDAARQDGPGGWSVAAHLISAEGEVQIGTGTAAAAPERRLVRVNGAAATATALSDWLALVWLTPAMDRLFSESSGSRRRFLDRLVQRALQIHVRLNQGVVDEQLRDAAADSNRGGLAGHNCRGRQQGGQQG